MLKQRLTILLVGLMVFSQVSGVLAVMCHGSEGHLGLELTMHDHCECPDAEADLGLSSIESDCQNYCIDTAADTGVMVEGRKTVKTSTQRNAISSFIKKTNTADGCIHKTAASSNPISSFHTPLRSIVILA